MLKRALSTVLILSMLLTMLSFSVLLSSADTTATETSTIEVTASNGKQGMFRGVKVTWNAIPGAVSYMVTRTLQKNHKMIEDKVVDPRTYNTSVLDVSVSAGMIYAYTVTATIKDGAKVVSQPVRIRNLPGPYPELGYDAKGMEISWDKVNRAKKYRIYRSEQCGDDWSEWVRIKTTTKSVYVDKTAKSGVVYRYFVRPVNGQYVGGYKISREQVYLAAPKSTAINVTGGVSLTWKKVGGATEYDVIRLTKRNGEWIDWTRIATTTDLNYVDKTAENGKVYSYAIRACQAIEDNSRWATCGAENFGKSLRRLTTPVVALKKVSSGVKVSWDKNPSAKGYYVYRRTYTNGELSAWKRIKKVKSGTSYVDKTAKKGITYRYTVKAYNGKYTSSTKTSGNFKR